MELALAHSRNVCVTKVLQVLMNCDMATPESILGDLVDPDANAAINLAQDRIERRKNHSNAVSPVSETDAEYIMMHIAKLTDYGLFYNVLS